MSDPTPPQTAAEAPTVARTQRFALNEDWLATAVGLLLVALVLTGVIPTGLVP
ncbi:hypothetical protein [Catellatospora citrea]|uniref:Uncharacterized protein n=1 Tax=Catellatospora citrea TaxID=53366 RepID=A0A8J3NWI2_9ACTN|nr:hypothetical protein [Catellatospora citrea]RKE06773.1 hypothetical protein C8E86_1595 [Catellatospora citrea]GIF94918.1 hypothetical protein Cci01nite_00120 [Catellatospora citrea]